MNSIKILFVTFFLILFEIAFSQVEDSTALFNKGVYLQNLNITIPWKTPFLDLHKYGNPVIAKEQGKMTATWDSVTIIDNIKAKLYFQTKRIFTKEKFKRFGVIGGLLDSLNADKFITFFNNKLGEPNSIIKKSFCYHEWRSYNFIVSIRKWDQYPNINRIQIQKFNRLIR